MNLVPKTTVEAVGNAELRVEISIGDMLDTPGAREGIRFAAVVATTPDRPLSAIQIRALSRARELIDDCIDALRPNRSA